MQVNEVEALFEPGEERDYGAVMDSEQVESSKIDVALLQAIAEAIEVIKKPR